MRAEERVKSHDLFRKQSRDARRAAVRGRSDVGVWAFQFTLVLTQTGSGLSGTVRLADVSIPVTGAAVTGTLSLTGHAVGSSTKADVQTFDLLQWASTLDATGAQRGTLTYRVSTTWGIAVPPPYPPFETWNRTFEGHITASCRTTDSTVTTCR